MKRVFIVHGFEGKPNGGWRPWLMGELAKQDIYACSLPMPSPNDPIKEEWVNTISQIVGIPTTDIFLVGHSLGVPAILRYMESLNQNDKIGGIVLVSGPIHKRMEIEYEAVNKFLEEPFNFDHIKKICKKFVIIHGDNDNLVSINEGEELSNKLSGNLIPIASGGHLNGSSGCFELPEALESLLKMMKD